jgi:hypothetical protein
MSFLRKIFSKRDAPIRTHDDFWNWFQQNEHDLYKVLSRGGDVGRDFFDRVASQVEQLYSGFLLLAGMSHEQTAELVFTVDGDVKRIAFVEDLVKAAPQIPGWRITALKAPVDLENMQINMNGFMFDDQRLSFYANEQEGYPDEVDITVVHQDLNDGNREQVTHGIFIFLDNYLGELNFVEDIDRLATVGVAEAVKPLIPISKLRGFLEWRKAEFVEKYDDAYYDTGRDNFSALEARLPNGKPLIAIINTTLLAWDRKASHPWIVRVDLGYEGEEDSGMPDDEAYELLDRVEDEIMNDLEDRQGYLNIGRQTADGVREIYFACKDFRKPSKVLYHFADTYMGLLTVTYSIFKDKYWQSFERFRVAGR